MPQRPLGPPEDPDRFEDFEECVEALMENDDLSREEAERICGKWENQGYDMTDADDPQHRAYHQPDPDDVELRDLEGDDGTFSVRMPIASTGEVRNEGDDPLTRDEIDGMARQIEERSVGVFLDHGSNRDIADSRYSAIGKVGEWRAAEVETRSDTGLLVADARLMDPETLPAATGDIREALAALKSQVGRDIPLSASIGWRTDEDAPGGNDLMEASIVGIPADPRTTSQDAAVTLARSALAGREDADPEQLVADFRAVVMGPDEQRQDTPLGRRLNELIDEAAETDEFEDRSDVIGELAQEASIDESTVRAIIEGDVECPPRGRLEAFARVLDTTTDALVSAAEEGECDYSEGDENQMSDDDTQSGDEPDDTNDSDGMDAQEYRESMLEMQQQQTETLSALADAVQATDEGGEDDDEDDEDEDEDEQSAADDTETQTIEVDDEELTAADIRELRADLAEAREAGDVETTTEDGDDDSEAEDTTRSTTDTTDELLSPR